MKRKKNKISINVTVFLILSIILLFVGVIRMGYVIGYNKGYMNGVNDFYCTLYDKITFNEELEYLMGHGSFDRALTEVEVSYLHKRGTYIIECNDWEKKKIEEVVGK